MRNEYQKQLENLKNFQLEVLLKKDYYIDALIEDKWYQGFIREENQNNKYEISYLALPNRTILIANMARKALSFFGDNYLQSSKNIREIILDQKVNKLNLNELYELLLNKLKEINIDYNDIEKLVSKIEENEANIKNLLENVGNKFESENNSFIIKDDKNQFNITGFYTYQFFSGLFIDTIVIIKNKLLEIRLSSVKSKSNLNLEEDMIQLLNCVLNLVIFVLIIGKQNISKIKNYVQNNRKMIIINKICSILASIESIISSILIIFCYEYFEHQDIEKKMKLICNLCYDFILNSTKDIKSIPHIQFLVNLIYFVTYEDNILRVENFNKNSIYKVLLTTLQNMNADDIKLIKNFADIETYCSSIIKKLYHKENNVLFYKCYYTFLINCLKKENILEKKIMALDKINDILSNLIKKENEVNLIFYDFFYNKNKIIDMFFEETVHDEILKRSNIIFKYICINDLLNDEIINKLIKLKNNNNIRKILCEIIKNIKNKDKKNNLFNKITKDFNFDNNDNRNNIIDFVCDLTLACFSSIEKLNDSEEDKSEKSSGNNESDDDNSNNNENKDIIKNMNKRISLNMKLLKMEGLKNINDKNFRKNFLRNNSYERLLINSSSVKNIVKIKKNEDNNKEKKKRNYYGLDLLFNYIMYNYNKEKAIENNSNILKSIKAFKYILDSSNIIKSKDISYFLDCLFDNINSNKKYNSIVQGFKLIEILLNKMLYNNGYNIAPNNSNLNEDNASISENNVEVLSILDSKYNIISLIVNDLIRYVNKVKESINENKKIKSNYKNEIFEGIYPYMKNISVRLNILFLFLKFGLCIEEKEISKIYSLFKTEQFISERSLFFREITNNIDYFNFDFLQQIFINIFDNEEFDKSSFNDEETLNLISELIININLLQDTIIDDNKTKRVNANIKELVGFDFLFDILISNKDQRIRNKLCQMLSHYCLYLSNYKKLFYKKYWSSYINKIVDLMEDCNENKNINGIFYLIQLIESIYSLCNNFSGKIPRIDEIHKVEDQNKLYHFCCQKRNKKEYKLKVGLKDKIFHMRWKLAYFYDIHVNDLVICDIDNNEYNFTKDDLSFFKVFPPQKYLISETKYILINVLESPGQILKLQNNPKELIENNENIINILIDNLSMENINAISKIDINMKENLWSIMQKLPKEKYIEESIVKYGENMEIPSEEIEKAFNVNEIFILTFHLKCILHLLFKGNQNQNKNSLDLNQITEFLNNFINFHHIDTKINNILQEIKLKNIITNDNNQFIYFECIKSLLKIIQIIDEFKNKKSIITFLNPNNRDNETIQTKEENINEKEEEEEEDEAELETTNINSKSRASKSNNGLSLYELDALFNKLTDILVLVLNDNIESNDSLCFELLIELIYFAEQIKNNSKIVFSDFFEYIFSKEELFKKIFIYDFIKCSKDEVKNLLSKFLIKNLFSNNQIYKKLLKKKNGNEINNQILNKSSFIKRYFDIIMTPEMFDYFANNQQNDSYFNILSTIIEKYIVYNIKERNNHSLFNIENQEEKNKLNEKLKKIIDAIIKKLNNINDLNKNKEQSLLSYPYKNPSITSSKRSNTSRTHINDILIFLLRILELTSYISNSIIEYFLNKLDICDFFLLKGIFNKCNENYNEKNDYINDNADSKKIIYEIITFLLKYLDNNGKNIHEKQYLKDSLYMKVWQTLNMYHKLGFWKKKKNWEISYIETSKREFVGLKNMSSTCYMNSILQQIFMIPMLRETILSIGKEGETILNKDLILYQLQLLLASLKLYDFKYYTPKKFVLASKLSFYEQMDADEYYCQLIDNLENEMSQLFNKKQNNKYNNLFKYFFGIKLNDELFFIDCNHKRFNESFCYNIQLEVKNYTNINDSLKNYFKTEIMSGDNKIICEECKIKRVCHKKLGIKILPNILVISLKRFDYNYTTMTKFKLNNYFEFPFELDISEFIINNNKNNDIENSESSNRNNVYELTGITIHYGISDFGHYYDLIKAANNKWYKFNDTQISEINESDIPREAFGDRKNEFEKERESMDTKSNFREDDKGNAYILIYSKKNFKNSIKNSEYSTNLVLPPYDKYSNINNNIKSIINFKMFKYWTLENLTNQNYQGFILELLKMDLIKNIQKEIENHNDLIDELKKGKYLPIQNYVNTGNTIFSFGLLYFCNIMLRFPKEKNNIHTCYEILTVYLENDINKCLYVLEEFSDEDILEEFFITCENSEAVKTISDLILGSFKNYLLLSEKDEDSENKIVNLYKFLNAIILFVSSKINNFSSNISFDNIVKLFSSLINENKMFLKYLKDKGINKWLDEIIKKINNSQEKKDSDENNDANEDEDNINMSFLLTNENFPKLDCNHCILKEKTKEFNIGKEFIKKLEENNNTKKQNSKNTKIKSNGSVNLLKKLQEDINGV